MGIEQALINQEQNVISICLKNNDYVLDIDSKYFLSEEARIIFIEMRNIVLSDHYNGEVKLRDLHTEVHKRGQEIDISILENLKNLDINTDEKAFTNYYKQLKQLWFQISSSQDSLKAILEQSQKTNTYCLEEVEEAIASLQANLHEVKDDTNNVHNLERLFDSYSKELQNRNLKQSHDTGCGHLDRMLTEGFAPGYITIIFGPSGVGKSTYGWYLVNKQINKMIPSIYFSFEMGIMSNMDRLVAQRLNMNYKSFYPDFLNDQMISPELQDLIQKEKSNLRHNFKYFQYIDADALSLYDIENIIVKYKRKMGVDYLCATIDLLTMVKDFNRSGGGDSTANKYEKSMNELAYLAKRTNCHIVGVVQGKRPSDRVRIEEVDQLMRFRPNIEELKNSGALEERARIVLGVFRQKHFANRYLPDDPATALLDDIMEISVLKQNSGTLGRIEYWFEPEKYKLTPYERPVNDIQMQEEEE